MTAYESLKRGYKTLGVIRKGKRADKLRKKVVGTRNMRDNIVATKVRVNAYKLTKGTGISQFKRKK